MVRLSLSSVIRITAKHGKKATGRESAIGAGGLDGVGAMFLFLAHAA
jgi:hypothetical protein